MQNDSRLEVCATGGNHTGVYERDRFSRRQRGYERSSGGLRAELSRRCLTAAMASATADFARLNLLGKSPAFLYTLELIQKISSCDATLLIEAETGTGKELVARAVHYLSERCDSPFVAVNCGGLPDTLLESELYGHERGAFTDARESAVGLVAQAQGGTLFLDEVETMSARAQVVLLRFLQDHEYRPVGGKVSRRADTRVIASSNVDLESMASRELFRKDLLFRLKVLPLRLPPLRERLGDAVVLAEAFIRRFSAHYKRAPKFLHPDTISFLNTYRWPGNVRELENLIHREYIFADGPVIKIFDPTSRPEEWDGARYAAHAATRGHTGFKDAKAKAIAQFERAYLATLLSRTQGNLSLAAKLAGKERSSFTRLLKKYRLRRSDFEGPSSTVDTH